MKIVEVITVIHAGPFASSAAWTNIRAQIHSAIVAAEWPPQSGSFTIHPESGKKRGMGNGVVPIKAKPMEKLEFHGWTLEYPWPMGEGYKAGEVARKGDRPGKIDAAKMIPEGLVVVEWETGNVSSSHRAINKMALALLSQRCVAGVLVVPNMVLARYLTDRIGNIDELRPYLPLWRDTTVPNGVLELVVIEQDFSDVSVARIPKGNDGRA